jgi:hypothetical protein
VEDPDAARTAMLERRYGTRRPGRRLAVIVVTVLVAGAGLGWLFWAAIVHSNPAVDADVASFHVKSVHRVDATVEVRVRDNDSAGTCLLRASAQDHSVVGEHRFRVDSATGRETTVPVRTERRAVTVEIVDCTPADG